MTFKCDWTNTKPCIVFLDQEPLTPRRKKAFEIELLLSEGFDVRFWNFSQFCFGEVEISGALTESYVLKINTLHEFKLAVKSISLNNAIFVFEGYLASIKPILNNYLISNGAKTVRYELNTTAALVKDASPFKRIAYLTRKQQFLLPLTLGKVLLAKLKQKINKPYTYVISTGDIYPCDIHINHSDYILYLESLKSSRFKEDDYILFLDQFYPFHPDLQSQGIAIDKNAAFFFRDLNNFFDLLEAQSNLKIVIAAHPKAVYDSTVFNGREIFHGKSNELVKDSSGVITIDSASISFVISHNKPLLLITSDDRLQTAQLEENNKYQRRLAQTIGTTVLNISQVGDLEISFPKFSEVQRNKYIYTYLTSPEIETQLNKDILPSIYRQIFATN